MNYPPFYDQIPPIFLNDPLTRILGVNADGIIVYTYLDPVKLAGHSCPTTAGAFLMLQRGLNLLYPDTLPLRGEIKVELQEAADAGSAGVVASIASLITGASDEKGFKGLGGNHARNGRLFFGAPIPKSLRLTRLDNGRYADIGYNPSVVPETALTDALKSRVMRDIATAEEARESGRIWQERVRKLLIDYGEKSEIISVDVGP